MLRRQAHTSTIIRKGETLTAASDCTKQLKEQSFLNAYTQKLSFHLQKLVTLFTHTHHRYNTGNI